METSKVPDAGDTGGRPERREATHGLPAPTHLQFLVLDVLLHHSEGTSATTLRDALRQYGEDREGPKFYQMMRRLEESGFIESWSQQFNVGGGQVSRTYYRVTAQGRVAWRLTVEFYASRLNASRAILGQNKSGNTKAGKKQQE